MPVLLPAVLLGSGLVVVLEEPVAGIVELVEPVMAPVEPGEVVDVEPAGVVAPAEPVEVVAPAEVVEPAVAPVLVPELCAAAASAAATSRLRNREKSFRCMELLLS
jgi:hypothetical protein